MRARLWFMAPIVLLCTLRARAQTAEQSLLNSLAHKQLVLRNYNGEDNVRGHWTGESLQLDLPRWHELAALTALSVKLKHTSLIIECSRNTIIKRDDGGLAVLPKADNVKIELDLGDASPDDVLPKIRGALFFGSIGEAIAALPKGEQGMVPASLTFPPPRKIDRSKPACDCAANDKTACPAGELRSGGEVPPKFLHGKDANFPNEARREQSVDAHVDVSLTVDTDGRPEDVWVLNDVGFGFAEAAAQSVLTYVFQPAMCHDKPVSVWLRVDVRFQAR